MNRDRVICSSYICLIKTCSRHRCHLPKWYSVPINWINLEDECNMFVSKDKWKNIDQEEDDEYFI